PRHELGQIRRAHVEVMELEPAGAPRPGIGEVGERAGRQVVDHVDGAAFGQQPIDEGRADEAGSPGYEDTAGVWFRAHGGSGKRPSTSAVLARTWWSWPTTELTTTAPLPTLPATMEASTCAPS